MLILASHLKNLPVVNSLTQETLGKTTDLVFDPDNGQVISILVKTLDIFPKIKVLSLIDIVDFAPDSITASSSEAIVDIAEIVRVKEIISKKYKIINQKAETKSGKSLGKIYEVLIESNTWSTVKYYIRSLVNERIFPYEKVEKITPRAVIFKDEVAEETAIIEEVPEAA